MPAPDTGCAPVADPLASLAPPSYGSCDHTDYVVNSSTATLSPGVYCGKLEINSGSTATLDPGVYIMDGATFIANSDSTILGDDVTIYLTGSDGYLKFNSDSHVQLSELNSNSSVVADGCSVQVNSGASDALASKAAVVMPWSHSRREAEAWPCL